MKFSLWQFKRGRSIFEKTRQYGYKSWNFRDFMQILWVVVEFYAFWTILKSQPVPYATFKSVRKSQCCVIWIYGPKWPYHPCSVCNHSLHADKLHTAAAAAAARTQEHLSPIIAHTERVRTVADGAHPLSWSGWHSLSHFQWERDNRLRK